MILLDMKMPDECALCPISCKAIMEVDIKSLALGGVKRLPNCPLKELPKGHGKLVDVNEVKKRMIPLDFSVQKWISEVDLDIYVPTVIEADNGVDN